MITTILETSMDDDESHMPSKRQDLTVFAFHLRNYFVWWLTKEFKLYLIPYYLEARFVFYRCMIWLILVAVPKASGVSFKHLWQFQRPVVFHANTCGSSKGQWCFMQTLVAVPKASGVSFKHLWQFLRPVVFHANTFIPNAAHSWTRHWLLPHPIRDRDKKS